MNLFGMLQVSGSALTAERQRAEVVTSNMANMETTRTPEGGPYRRQLVVFRSRRMPQFPALLAGFGNVSARGVRVDQVIADAKPPLQRYQPGASRCRCQRVCELSRGGSGRGNRRSAGRGTGLRIECVGGAIDQNHDPAIFGSIALTIFRADDLLR